jgi:hypothetical protein
MSERQGPSWIQVGRHAYIEEPAEATIYIRLEGDLSVEDVPPLIDPMRRFAAEDRPRVFLVVDMAGMGDIGPAARKELGGHLLDVPIGAVAVFGASFAQRVVATLADKMNNFVRGERRYETRFFATEEQARAWLGRKRLAAANAPSGEPKNKAP